MEKENTAKSMSQHALTQFDLSKKVLNNLSQFNLKPTAKLVLLYLCDCYNPDHGEMFPKQSTIAQKMGVSEISVIRAIQELHNEGLLISERKYTNKYRFTSRIVSEQSENYHNNMIDNNYQKDIEESIKKIAPCNRTKQDKQIKEQNNNSLWGNVYYSNFSQTDHQISIKDFYTPEEYKILKKYALKFTSEENVERYITGIRKKGGDKSILKEHRKKAFVAKRAESNIAETQRLIQQNKQDELTAESYERSQSWLEFGRKIGRKK